MLENRYRDLKVLIVGLARTGVATAQFFVAAGAQVTMTDIKPAESLAESLASLAGLNIRYYLGHHPEHLLQPGSTDLIVVNPGVPQTIPFLQQALAQGQVLTTETRLFSQHCPAPIVGISGSSGKTTTTTLVGLMLEASGYQTKVGGNIGTPLITALSQIQRQDRVVLELSSFQLEYFHPAQADTGSTALRPLQTGWSPAIATLLNITPNHLDRHGTMAAYTAAKEALVRYQRPEQVAILGADDPITYSLGQKLASDVRWFSLENAVKRGACVVDEQISLVETGQVIPICPVETIKLRGRHNRYNVLAACATAYAAGANIEAMQAVITQFSGVAHRLEDVAVRDGVTFVNDSIATSPERMMAALQAFAQPIVLLAGGKDKKLPWDEAAALITNRVKDLILFGQDADLIAKAVRARQKLSQAANQVNIHQTDSLENAVKHALNITVAGDLVLLSPGCTSYDAYPDFAARGEHFRELVLNL